MSDDFKGVKELFEWNKRVFVFMGVWPLQPTYIKFTMWIVYLLIQMTMEFADLYQVFGNLELVILNLSESTLETMIIIKMIVLRFSKKLMQLMGRIIDGVDARNYQNNEEMEIYMKYNRVAKKFFRIWFTMGVTASIVYHLKPLEFRINAVFQNESIPFVLPYRTRLGFEVKDSSTFWLVWTYQAPMICINMFHSVTIGYLFTLVLHVCGQLSILSYRIRNLDLSAQNDNASSRIIFRDIVVRHRSILGLTRDINDIFGILFLEELFISTVLIGLTSYSVLVNVDFDDTGVFVSYLLYGATMLLLIYGYCVAGEYLINESEILHNAYYQCHWCDMSDSFKKQLVICMIGASKPIQLTGGGFYIFSLSSFTGVLKTAGSYISMLRTMI